MVWPPTRLLPQDRVTPGGAVDYRYTDPAVIAASDRNLAGATAAGGTGPGLGRSAAGQIAAVIGGVLLAAVAALLVCRRLRGRRREVLA
ncbi:hypothetical protein [Dactylosporangium sp. NPDC048998]|uniref:hypothetical protein n=1 Tax=Dactylosporangium sp. NPDC048998 TaxID=3363976 RepID=UPI00372288AF